LTKEVYRNSSAGAAGSPRPLGDATTCPYGMRTASRGRRIGTLMMENEITMVLDLFFKTIEG
jgi:hypothetical protein